MYSGVPICCFVLITNMAVMFEIFTDCVCLCLFVLLLCSVPIHDRCCAGLCAAAYRRGAVLYAGGRLYDTLALVEWYRLW